MSDNRQNPPVQTLTEETPADANLVAKLEPTTPNLRLPLPGYTLDVDLARIRDAFLKVDALSVSLEDNNEQAAATADDALEVAAQAKREAERAKATAAEAVNIAESKATAADVEAHNQTKDAHGATSEPEPGAIALRDEFGRIKAEAPEADKDAANKSYVDTGLADAETAMKAHVQTEIDAIDRVPEAPKNGKAHLREDGEWVERQPLLHMAINSVNMGGGYQYIGVKADGNNVLAVAYSSQYAPPGKSFVSTDGGRTFTANSMTLPKSPISNGLALSGASALLLTDDFVYRSTDRGASWGNGTHVGSSFSPKALAMDGDAAVIVGEGISNGAIISTNKFMYSSNAGASWQTLTLSKSIKACSVAISGNKAVITSSTTQALRSIDGGASWTNMVLPSQCRYVVMRGDIAIAVADDASGRVLRSMDGGATWSIVTLPVYYSSISSVDVFENIIVISFTNALFLFYSTDYGETWKTVALPSFYNMNTYGAVYSAIANGDSVPVFYGNRTEQYRGYFV